jgi:hypothetical protein
MYHMWRLLFKKLRGRGRSPRGVRFWNLKDKLIRHWNLPWWVPKTALKYLYQFKRYRRCRQTDKMLNFWNFKVKINLNNLRPHPQYQEKCGDNLLHRKNCKKSKNCKTAERPGIELVKSGNLKGDLWPSRWTYKVRIWPTRSSLGIRTFWYIGFLIMHYSFDFYRPLQSHKLNIEQREIFNQLSLLIASWHGLTWSTKHNASSNCKYNQQKFHNTEKTYILSIDFVSRNTLSLMNECNTIIR